MYQEIPDYLRVPLLQMNATAQLWSLYGFSALAILTVVWALYRSKVEGTISPLLYAIGGGLTCFLEPILARLGHATHAQIGQNSAYESLGLLIPWHAEVSYTFYFGLAYILLIPAFKARRFTPRKIWLILVAIVVSAWVYEAPLISIGLWSYYGGQPYQPFGLMPIWWSAASAAMLIVPTTLIARFDEQLLGWRKIFIIALAPMGAMGGAAAVCWPIWVTLNSRAGVGLQYFAATLTIAFTCLTVWFAIPLVAKRD